MTENFYIKAQALHGEFQKRELHYLNAERKLHSSMMHKKELNLPFQEYLQKINQREKETEETYRNIMTQMENLDRQTDSMTLKLEKLGILRNSLAIPLQRWTSSVVGSNLQMYSTPLNSNSKLDHFSLESVESNVKTASDTSLKSELTQTEDIYCEECGYLLQNQFHSFLKNSSQSVLNNSCVVNDKSPDTYSTKYQNQSYTLSEDHIHSQFGTSSINSVLPSVLVNTDENMGENHEAKQQIIESSYRKNSIKELNERYSSVENISKSKEIAPISIPNTTDQNEEKIIDSQQFESENYESKSPNDEPNINTFVSKSDAESMNNEFDFLESDTRNKSSKTNTKIEKYPSYNIDTSFDRVSNSVEEHPKDLPSKQKENKNIIHSNLKLEQSDDKSETSGSVSGPHSPNISLASDSDSSFKKGSPLKASAAYQALLGNTIIPQNINRGNSDSDTEDEVEKALASVAQRSNVKSKSSIQIKPDSSVQPKTPQAADTKLAVKGSKPPSVNKPQSKLSKSTRKVLGLDTSSGSEVELAVKPPEKKIDEDSDEFDFYD